MLALLIGPFMAQADATIANVATPSIHHSLHASGAALELVIGGYLVAFAVLIITGARLGQTHGYRRVLLCGIAVFSIASLLCGLAPTPALLVAARVLQGAGAALMFPQTLTGIQLRYEGAARKRAIGFYAIALSSGAVVGQIAGGALTSAIGWRSIFLVNVPIGVVGLLLVKRLSGDEPRRSRAIDVPGDRAAVGRDPADRAAARDRPRRGLAGLDVALPCRRRSRLRGVRRRRAPGQRAAGEHGGHHLPAGRVGPDRARAADRHVLRAAVHARPVPAGRPGPQRDRVGPDARPVGRRVRPRRPARLALPRAHARRRLHAAGGCPTRRSAQCCSPAATTRVCCWRCCSSAGLGWGSTSAPCSPT